MRAERHESTCCC